MRHCTLLFIMVPIGLIFSGCSKPSSGAVEPSVTYTNLGVVEVSDGIPIYHGLGGGRAYVLTPTIFKDGSVEMKLDLQETNASGVVTTVQGPISRNMPDTP